jgi:hypothetical protein
MSCTLIEIDLANLMVYERDALEDPEGAGKAWFVNTGRGIGKQVTSERVAKCKSALAGDKIPFKGKDKGHAEVAAHMVNTTRLICHVRERDDGSVLGDCIQCYKKLSCNCCVFIRNWRNEKIGAMSLKLRATGLPQRKSGRPRTKGLGGCKPVLPSLGPVEGLYNYYDKKTQQKICELCKVLGLAHSEKVEKETLVRSIIAKGRGETSMTEQNDENDDVHSTMQSLDVDNYNSNNDDDDNMIPFDEELITAAIQPARAGDQRESGRNKIVLQVHWHLSSFLLLQFPLNLLGLLIRVTTTAIASTPRRAGSSFLPAVWPGRPKK